MDDAAKALKVIRVRILGFACRNCRHLKFHALEVIEDDAVDAARER